MRCRFESCRFHPALPVIVNGAKSDNLGRTTTVVRSCMRCLPRAWAGLFLQYVAAVSQGNREEAARIFDLMRNGA